MDNWYNELVGGNVEDISRAADILTNNVKQRSFDINNFRFIFVKRVDSNI